MPPTYLTWRLQWWVNRPYEKQHPSGNLLEVNSLVPSSVFKEILLSFMLLWLDHMIVYLSTSRLSSPHAHNPSPAADLPDASMCSSVKTQHRCGRHSTRSVTYCQNARWGRNGQQTLCNNISRTESNQTQSLCGHRECAHNSLGGYWMCCHCEQGPNWGGNCLNSYVDTSRLNVVCGHRCCHGNSL